jgi:hypothetical protein
MAFANFSLSTAYTAIITALNTQLTAVGSLFKDQTTGDFTGQIRYNSALKKLQYCVTGGTATWAELELTLLTDETFSIPAGLVCLFSVSTSGGLPIWLNSSSGWFLSNSGVDIITNTSSQDMTVYYNYTLLHL